jgi:hypothetical protein
MLDPFKRKAWFREYLVAARKASGTYGSKEVYAWAKSMSLIAEQFVDNHEGEPADPTPVD